MQNTTTCSRLDLIRSKAICHFIDKLLVSACGNSAKAAPIELALVSRYGNQIQLLLSVLYILSEILHTSVSCYPSYMNTPLQKANDNFEKTRTIKPLDVALDFIFQSFLMKLLIL